MDNKAVSFFFFGEYTKKDKKGTPKADVNFIVQSCDVL